MSEFHIAPKPALADRTPIEGSKIALKALPEEHVILVMGKASGADIQDRLTSLSDGALYAIRAAGPGQWFIVGNQTITHNAFETLCTTLGPDVYGVDQGAGRFRIHLYGAMAERVLAKGTAVDLALSNFPIGHSTTTLIGHIATHITRTGEYSFELMFLRGFAESLWDDLVKMSMKYS